jgi:hypothetical protein
VRGISTMVGLPPTAVISIRIIAAPG